MKQNYLKGIFFGGKDYILEVPNHPLLKVNVWIVDNLVIIYSDIFIKHIKLKKRFEEN